MRLLDVSALAALVAADEQDDHFVAVPAEVNAVSWPNVEATFHDARAYRLTVSWVAQRHLPHAKVDTRACLYVKRLQPFGVKRSASVVAILAQLEHGLDDNHFVAFKLQLFSVAGRDSSG